MFYNFCFDLSRVNRFYYKDVVFYQTVDLFVAKYVFSLYWS